MGEKGRGFGAVRGELETGGLHSGGGSEGEVDVAKYNEVRVFGEAGGETGSSTGRRDGQTKTQKSKSTNNMNILGAPVNE